MPPAGRISLTIPIFWNLKKIAQGTAETQMGDHIQEGIEPDWKKVLEMSLALLARSRDPEADSVPDDIEAHSGRIDGVS